VEQESSRMSSVNSDANKVHSAIKGLGTDNATLIKILTSKGYEYNQELATEYIQVFGHSLLDDLKHDTSGNYQELLLALVRPRADYLAQVLHTAMKGLGTNDRMLINVLSFATNDEIPQIKASYSAQFKHELEKDLLAEVKGVFLEGLQSLLEGNRSVGSSSEAAKRDADEIYQQGEGKGKAKFEDKFFLNFFTKNSSEHIQSVNQAYNAAHGHPLAVAIKKDAHGEYKELLLALAAPRLAYFANRIRESIKGIGTNDRELIYAFVLNSDELVEVREVYWKMFNVHMEDDIRGDTSGNYQITLMCMLKGHH